MKNQELNKEIEPTNKEFLDPVVKKRKLVTYVIRTIIAIGVYTYFWNLDWIRWTLIVYIPLNLFGLYLVLYGDKLIQNKINKTKNND